MPWGSLSGQQQISILVNVRGGAAAAAQIKGIGSATTALGTSMNRTTKRSFLMNQALFTLRRITFYTTLGIIGLTAEVARLGFSYDSTMQSARVALQPVIKGSAALNDELNQLFKIAAFTPFTFKDITTAFRQMYAGLQPLGISAGTVNQTIQSIADALSFTGKSGVGSLNRVSIALQHLANIGRPTGQVLLQLARDGLPIYPILRKELGLTEDQMKNISSSGITALQVIQSINKYVQSTPGFKNAALRQANLTVSGAFTTFKDLLSQAAGGAFGGGGSGASRGPFGFIQKSLFGINKQLENSKGPVTFMELAKAIDKQLSPKTHLLLNLFILFNYFLKGFIGTLYVVVKTIQLLLRPFDFLANLLDKNHSLAKVLGTVLGILAGLWLANAIRAGAYALAVDAATAAEKIWLVITKLVNGAMIVQDALLGGNLIARWVAWAGATEFVATGMGKAAYQLKNLGIMAAASRWLIGLGAAFTAAGGGAAGFAAALRLLVFSIPVIGWIAGIATAVTILYFKWKRFHDVVDATFHLLDFGQGGKGGKPWWNKGLLDSIPGGHFHLGQLLPHFGVGGIMSSSGMALVGERGPEMVYLPAGSRVVPQTQTSISGSVGFGGSSGNNQPIVVQVMLDRKVLAEGVARANQDQRGRR